MPIDLSKSIIDLENVSFSYGKNIVLKNINLGIHQGDYIGVVGPNGGGKTTLLRLILGLLKPTTGTIKMFGSPLALFQEKHKLAYLAQKITNFDQWFPITVWDVVSMGRLTKVGMLKNFDKEDLNIINKSLEQVSMEKQKDHLIGELSGGQLQRVLIARALAQQPSIIFLDEPTAGVDVDSQAQFYTLLKNLNQDLGITLVLVSHDLDIVANEVTEVACINQTLIYHGGSRDFKKEEQKHHLYARNTRFIVHKH